MYTNSRILILYSRTSDINFIVDIINTHNKDCVIKTASTLIEWSSIMEQFKFDLIISEYKLDDFDGTFALKYLRVHNPKMPCIFITNETLTEEQTNELLQLGATDIYPQNNIVRVKSAIVRVLSEVKNIKELHELELRLYSQANMLQHVNNVIIATDANGTINYINLYSEKLLGIKLQDVVGKHASDLFSQSKQVINDIIDHKGAGLLLIEQTWPFYRSDGTELTLNIVMSSWCNANDLLDGFLLVATDITEQLKARQQLIDAKKNAEELNSLKSYFLANMSHEFRSPLNSIIGFAELLESRVQETASKEMTGYIINDARRLLESLNNVIELSAIEPEKVSIDRKTCRIGTLVKTCMQKYTPDLKQKKLVIKFDNIDESIEAVIDPVLIDKIILHLLENAINYTIEGVIEIRVYKAFINNEVQAVISCSDTGIGISKQEIEKMFEPNSPTFTDPKDNVRQAFAIIRKYVEIMQGTIHIESEVNVGSTFYISFNAIENINAEVLSNSISPATNEANVSLPSILLVEDNELNRILVKTYLEDIFNIIEAPTGEEALSILTAYKYVAVLMDIHLGEGIDGIETMKHIRKNSAFTNVPIIAVTAYALQDDEKNLLEKGFDAYIAKPFTQSQLMKALQMFAV